MACRSRRRTSAISARVAFGLVAAAFGVRPASAGVVFQGLGVLANPGGTPGSAVAGLGADGSTVVGTSSGLPMRWTATGGMQSLGLFAVGGDGYAQAVNGDGSVVVGYAINSLQNNYYAAFRWTPADGIQRLGPSGVGSHAYAISRDGAIAAGNVETGGGVSLEPYRWTGSGPVSLGAGLVGTARGSSADGSVIVGGLGARAFRWTASGGAVDLGLPAGTNSTLARAANASGDAAVGRAVLTGSSQNRAAIWRSGSGWQVFGVLPGDTSSEAYGVDDSASWIVGISRTASVARAMLIGPGIGMVDLNSYLPTQGIDLSGWTLISAVGVSADGRTIAGTGFHTLSDGSVRTEGWIATIPSPGAAAPLVMAGAAGARRRRKLAGQATGNRNPGTIAA